MAISDAQAAMPVNLIMSAYLEKELDMLAS